MSVNFLPQNKGKKQNNNLKLLCMWLTYNIMINPCPMAREEAGTWIPVLRSMGWSGSHRLKQCCPLQAIWAVANSLSLEMSRAFSAGETEQLITGLLACIHLVHGEGSTEKAGLATEIGFCGVNPCDKDMGGSYHARSDQRGQPCLAAAPPPQDSIWSF